MARYWELAKDMELEGKKFYERIAAESEIKELKGVFNFLALQEEVHYHAFCRLEGNEDVSLDEKISALRKAKEVFSTIAPDFSAPPELNTATEAYKKARKLELAAVKYYRSLLESEESADQQKAIEQIIREEESHIQVLDALIEFISRPNEWLENAEFTHLEAY